MEDKIFRNLSIFMKKSSILADANEVDIDTVSHVGSASSRCDSGHVVYESIYYTGMLSNISLTTTIHTQRTCVVFIIAVNELRLCNTLTT